MSYRTDDNPRLISEITDLEERAARVICANQGACQNEGCKVGKGLAPSPDNCVASREELFRSGHVKVARTVLSVNVITDCVAVGRNALRNITDATGNVVIGHSYVPDPPDEPEPKTNHKQQPSWLEELYAFLCEDPMRLAIGCMFLILAVGIALIEWWR